MTPPPNIVVNMTDQQGVPDNACLAELFKKMNGYTPVTALRPDFVPETPVRIKPTMPPELRKAWDLALFEVESNGVASPYGGRYFTAGGRGVGWRGMIFGQDTFGAGLLALNTLYPDLMKSQIRTYCLARVNIGFIGPRNWLIEGLEKAVPLDLDVWVPGGRQFAERYSMSPALNRTGMDVGWLWNAADLFDRHGDLMDWAWLYGMGDLFFDYFYKPFHDERDGLYWGQPSFVDVGVNGYPPEFGRRTQAARNKGLWVKATSTNCMYVKSMEAMASAAERLGMSLKAAGWREAAARLTQAIRDTLRFPDGTFTYFKHPDGRLEPRQEALGAALAVLSGVVTGEEAVAAIRHYPITDLGVPIIHPFYDNSQGYHNNASWPFIDAFFMMACEKATGRSFGLPHARSAAYAIHDDPGQAKTEAPIDVSTGTFAEVVNWMTRTPGGHPAQMWSICGFLNLCLRSGWTTPDVTWDSRFLNTRRNP